jgi:glycosyltransferase involved in cell wall biosynthesis
VVTDASSISTTPASPRVSVVVPVRNRRELLRALLDALDAQMFDDFEVVVVDDGSSDGADTEAATSLVKGRPVRVVHSGGGGAVAARRIGVAATRGQILAFTDSDCQPAAGWLSAGVAALDEGADMVNGLTQPTRALRPLERSMGSGLEGLYPTCNMLFKREAYEAAGGFDQAAADRLGFRPTSRARGLGFGEDTLLGWRIARAGSSRYVPEALVHHHVFEPDLRESISRVLQVGAFPALIREVPELRQTLMHHRWLFAQRSRVPVYATAAAAVVGRRRLVAACVGWWVVTRLRDLGRSDVSWSDRLRVLPTEMLLDVIWCGALVTGSVRARTLVL